MIFTDEFLKGLNQDDPVEAALKLCQRFIEFCEHNRDDYEMPIEPYIGSYTFIAEYCRANEIGFDLPRLSDDPTNILNEAFQRIRGAESYFGQANTKRLILVKEAEARKLVTKLASKSKAYQFSTADLEELQKSINQLRNLASKTTHLTDEHKRRLLIRLESLQAELHKRVSNIDHFLGVMSDVGAVIRKVGDDAKPMVEAMQKIAKILGAAYAAYHGLPHSTPSPVLPPATGKKDGDNLLL